MGVMRCAALAAAVVLCACLLSTHVDAKKTLQKKLRMRGKDYKLEKGTDLKMCDAIVHEMHKEVAKHSLRDGGEDEIFDTAGMAICLGVVQWYTFAKNAKDVWSLSKREMSLDEAEESDSPYGGMLGMGGEDGGTNPDMMEGLMLTKEACVKFAEDLQMDISEVMYAGVVDKTPEEISAEFCPKAVRPEPKTKRTKVTEEVRDTDTQSSDRMQEFLREKDTSGTIAELLEMESLSPEKMLTPQGQAEVKQGRIDIACKVCKTAVRKAGEELQEIRKTPVFKDRWQRDSIVTDLVAGLCHGEDWEKIKEGYMPRVPGDPPVWVDQYDVRQDKEGTWELRRTSATMEESKSQEMHDAVVRRRAMITGACRTAIDDRLEQANDGDDLAELLIEKIDETPKAVAAIYCEAVCKGRKSEL
mmetsp:Transcript_51569/g.122816  ORF Transcript_51569/g.122816 Transcript_51569/m.122816 type:complete len:415 (-) Transcript_51569:88-1332(-)